MPLMSIDDIKSKAPDRTAFTAAKKLASPTHWGTLGQEGQILWGVAVGSKGDEYAVYIDMSRDALECSCPSRKRPCKHTLGLLILEASGHAIPTAPAPSDHKWKAEDRYSRSWE